MPENNDVFKRYLDVGLAFTQLTRAKAEELVKEWVKAGEVQRDQAQQRVDDLLERSRKNSEDFLGTIRREVSNQLSTLGLATKADLEALEARLTATASASAATARPAAASTAPAAPAAPASATTPAATAKKAPAKRPAKATASSPAGTPGAAASKATASKATASKATAKKAPAKKAGGSATS